MASDNDSDEDFVTYGTPLEPLEEDEPLRKPVPLHEQTVKDEKGRFQRFHGAFTGGFSAGYFNTVGSKEGWTPSSFVSSRQQKAEKQHARPEDFMDEEDLSEHGIAPREITTSKEFSSSRRDLAREKAQAISALSAPIPGDTLLEELIAPARSSIGVELLRRMGWKEGQGVGPRVKRRTNRQKTDGGARVYGCAPRPAGSEDSEDSDEEFAPENVTFAPKDVTPMDFSPKVGVQGLGYRGLDPGLALVGRSAPKHIDLFNLQSDRNSQLFGDKQQHTHRGGVAGQAFGVGALEDDDEDIYQRDALSNYDTVLGGEEPGDGLYGWTAPQQYTKKKDHSKDSVYLGKILEGFTLASKSAEEKTIFPPPSLPRDYRPVHYFRPVVDVSSVSPALADALRASRGQLVQGGDQSGGRHQLDSSQRRALLGETALQGHSSVMDLLRSEDRERLVNLCKSSNLPSSPVSGPHTTLPSPGALAKSSLSSRFQPKEVLASWPDIQGSQTFRPFEENPSKQARYDLYLRRLKQGDKDALEASLDPNMTEWEKSREREEFVRASILYRPSSSSLASRFTRGKHQEDDNTVEVSQDQEADVDDKQAAVTMKMFGKLTRDSFQWHPDKLLCKRFNVPDPYPGSSTVGLLKVKRDKFSVFNFLTVAGNLETPAAPKLAQPGRRSRWDVPGQVEDKKDPLSEFLSVARNQASGTQPEQDPAPTVPASSASTCTPTPDPTTEVKSSEQPSADNKNEGDEEEEESRPPMDLFKAIFATSSDEKSSSSQGESEDEEDEKDDEKGQAEPRPPNLFDINPSHPVSSATSSQQTVVPSAEQADPGPALCSQNSTQEEEEFGPKLPPPSCALTTGCASPTNEDKPRRRSKEKHKAKKQHKHKKEKKKKHKKHKHKGKQQKKSKKEPSSSSSDDSDEDRDSKSGQVSSEELLKRLKGIRSKQRW
ncbi:G patch domain-containing protein 1 isoform X2 [Myripristis murdjan]|uniref:G patch domain-containing protein 1 isoform X2 n=1 Tax=Myripristis murdjan TaxID=586833 RepID=UPI0011763C58|nr:G patch domain-containing protein 1 isoform X2 [Myripristis murdjan]